MIRRSAKRLLECLDDGVLLAEVQRRISHMISALDSLEWNRLIYIHIFSPRWALITQTSAQFVCLSNFIPFLLLLLMPFTLYSQCSNLALKACSCLFMKRCCDLTIQKLTHASWLMNFRMLSSVLLILLLVRHKHSQAKFKDRERFSRQRLAESIKQRGKGRICCQQSFKAQVKPRNWLGSYTYSYS